MKPYHNNNSMTSDVLKLTVKIPLSLTRFGHLFRNVAYFRAVRRLQKVEKFDLIVFNQALFGVVSRWFLPKKLKTIGFIWDDHSLLPTWNTHPTRGSYFYYRFLQRPLELAAIHQLDKLLTCSDYINNLIIEKCSITPSKITTIRQLLEIKNVGFRPRAWQANGRQVKVLFVKLGYVRGGLEDLIRALGLLSNYQFELTIIGPFSKVAHAEISHWAASFRSHASRCIRAQ